MGDNLDEPASEGGMPPLICDPRFLAAQPRESLSGHFMVVRDGRCVFPGTGPECRQYIARHSGTSAKDALTGGGWQLVPLPPAMEADDPAWRLDPGWPVREDGAP